MTENRLFVIDNLFLCAWKVIYGFIPMKAFEVSNSLHDHAELLHFNLETADDENRHRAVLLQPNRGDGRYSLAAIYSTASAVSHINAPGKYGRIN